VAINKPNLTRIWAATAAGGDVVDPDVQTPGKFSLGWGAEKPPYQFFNFMQKLFTQGLGYFDEQGIGFWNTDTDYQDFSITKGSNGSLYFLKASGDGTIDPVSDGGTNWTPLPTRAEVDAKADQATTYTKTEAAVDFGSTTDDVDTLVKSGFYRVETNANLPSGGGSGQLIVARGGDTILQLVSNYTGRLWQRSGNPSNAGGSGSYSDWQEIPSLAGGADANFTAMPQVGGDPIVESGSNADGEWTRWSDGTQIVSGSFNINLTLSSRYTVLGEYPVAFVDIYAGSITCAENFQDIDKEAVVSVTLRTRANFEYMCSGTGDSTSISFSCSVIGRWK